MAAGARRQAERKQTKATAARVKTPRIIKTPSDPYHISIDRYGGATLTHPDGTDVYAQPGDDTEYMLDALGLDPRDWRPGDWDYLTDIQASIASEYFSH